jgi:hypothetical protein
MSSASASSDSMSMASEIRSTARGRNHYQREEPLRHSSTWRAHRLHHAHRSVGVAQDEFRLRQLGLDEHGVRNSKQGFELRGHPLVVEEGVDLFESPLVSNGARLELLLLVGADRPEDGAERAPSSRRSSIPCAASTPAFLRLSLPRDGDAVDDDASGSELCGWIKDVFLLSALAQISAITTPVTATSLRTACMCLSCHGLWCWCHWLCRRLGTAQSCPPPPQTAARHLRARSASADGPKQASRASGWLSQVAGAARGCDASARVCAAQSQFVGEFEAGNAGEKAAAKSQWTEREGCRRPWESTMRGRLAHRIGPPGPQAQPNLALLLLHDPHDHVVHMRPAQGETAIHGPIACRLDHEAPMIVGAD